MDIQITPIGFVATTRKQTTDDFWGGEQSCISLTDDFAADALAGLETFSHVEVLFQFHQAATENIVSGARHPRNNSAWPAVGIFAQRAKNRPNRIGSTICRVIKVEGNNLYVAELDAIDGTPIIDVKPVMKEFLPRHIIIQPEWSHELMRDYWLDRQATRHVAAANMTTVEIKAFLPAKDFELSKSFYTDLGFTTAWSSDELAYLHAGNCSFLLSKFYQKEFAENLMMHLLVEDVDAWWQQVTTQQLATRYGIRAAGPEDRPWGIRDFTITDPAGVLWRIGKNIEVVK